MNKRIIPANDPRWFEMHHRAEYQMQARALVWLLGPAIRAMNESSEAFALAIEKLKDKLERAR